MKIQGLLKSVGRTAEFYGGKRIPCLWSFSRKMAGNQRVNLGEILPQSHPLASVLIDSEGLNPRALRNLLRGVIRLREVGCQGDLSSALLLGLVNSLKSETAPKGQRVEENISLLRNYLQGLGTILKGKRIELEQHISIENVINGIRDEIGRKIKDTKYLKKIKGELSDIVNDNDEAVAVTEAGLSHMFGLGHRTANCFVFTPSGELILQRRVHNKAEAKKLSIFGGHVTAGQSYIEAMHRELLEELSLDEIEVALQNNLLLIGQDGQFLNEDPKNMEFRSLYAYVLTEKEYEHILGRKRHIEEEQAKRTVDEFEQWLEAEQKGKSGYGEVWGYQIVNFSELWNRQNMVIRETYKDARSKEEVGFTGDLLSPLVLGTAPLRQGIPRIDPMKEVAKELEEELQGTPYYGSYLQAANLSKAMQNSNNYYSAIAVVVKRKSALYMQKALESAKGRLIPSNSEVTILDCSRPDQINSIFNEHRRPHILVCVIDENINGVLSAIIEALNGLRESGCNFTETNLAMILSGGMGRRNYPITAGGGLGNKGLMKGLQGEPNIYQVLRQAMQFYQPDERGVKIFEADKIISICRPLPKTEKQDVQVFGQTVQTTYPFLGRHPKVAADRTGQLRRLVREGTEDEKEFLRGKKEVPISNLSVLHLSHKAIEALFEKHLRSGKLEEKGLTVHRDFLLVKEAYNLLRFGFVDAGRATLCLHLGNNQEYYDACRQLFYDPALRSLTNTSIDSRTGAIMGTNVNLGSEVVVGAGAVILGRTSIKKGKIAPGAVVIDSRIGHIDAQPESMLVAVEEPGDAVVRSVRGEILCDVRTRDEKGELRKIRVKSTVTKSPKAIWHDPLPEGISFASISEDLDNETTNTFLDGRIEGQNEATPELPFDKLRDLYGFKNASFARILFGGGSSKIEESPLLITADEKRYVLRHLPDEGMTKYVVSYQLKLKEAGLPVPSIIPLQEKHYFVSSGRYYYLEEYLASGEEVAREELTEAHYAGMGRMAAKMHNAVEKFNPEGINIRKLREEIGSLVDEFKVRKEELTKKKAAGDILSEVEKIYLHVFDLLIEQTELFRRRYDRFLKDGSPDITIHGDLAHTNVRFDRQGNVVGIFDLSRAHKTKGLVELNQIVFGRRGIGAIDFDDYNFMVALEAYQNEINRQLGVKDIRAMFEVLRSRFLEDLRNSMVNAGHRYYVSPENDDYQKRIQDVRAVVREFRKFIRYAGNTEQLLLSIQKDTEAGENEQALIKKRIFETKFSVKQLPLLVSVYQSLDMRSKGMVLQRFGDLLFYDPDSNTLEACMRRIAQESGLAWAGEITKRGELNVAALTAVLRELMLNPLSPNRTIIEDLGRKYGVEIK